MLRRATTTAVIGTPILVLVASKIYREQNRPVSLSSSYDHHSLHNHNVALTGGTSGIGLEVAKQLHRRGANLILGSRDAERGEAARVAILGQDAGGVALPVSTRKPEVRVLPLDVSDPSSVRTFTSRILKDYEEVDVVVSAAAEVITDEGRVTKGGVDLGFATNHLGLHGLIRGLEPALLKAGQKTNTDGKRRRPRVVIVGSRLEQKGDIDVEILRNTKGGRLHNSAADSTTKDKAQNTKFNPMKAYADTKHANMLLLTHLSHRWTNNDLKSSGVTNNNHPEVYAVTPGMVDTNLWRHSPLWYRALTYPIRFTALRSAEEAAEGVVYVATAVDLDGKSGTYWGDGVEVEPSANSRDRAKAKMLWEVCERLIEVELG